MLFRRKTQEAKEGSRVKRIAWGLGKLAILLFLLVVIVPVITLSVSRVVDIGDIDSANSSINSLFFPFFLFRACLYVLIYTFYERITLFVGRRKQFSDAQIANLQTKRTQMMLLLISMEVVLTIAMLMRV